MNRRFLALALAGTLTLSLLTACGGGNDTPNAETTPPAVEETTPVPESSAPVEESQEPESTPSSKPSAAPTTKPTQKPAESSKPSATPAPTPTPESKPQTDVVASVWNDISALELPSMTELDDSLLSSLYGINASDLVSYKCYMPLMGVHATEFFVAEVKDGKMDTVKAGVEKRQADLDTQWSQYLPEQYELVKNYKLVTSGNYILFAIGEQADQAVSIFNSYTK